MSGESFERKPTVVVIDDDESVREALCGLFESVDLLTETFGSVKEYLSAPRCDIVGCIVLDIRLPGQSGLEFQEALSQAEHPPSVVMISAHVDVAMTVRAMRAGATDVLTKPVREQDLLDAVNRAIVQDASRRSDGNRKVLLRSRYALLTEREREIMDLVVAGRLNKQIAAGIAISEATVKLHRGHVMQKMEAASLADLVRMADFVCNDRSTHNRHR
jgi:FixJ family two-component response regulator